MSKAYAMIPVYLAVPVLYWLVFREAGFPMHWAAFGIGAFGWWIAYLLRIPITLALKRSSPNEQPTAIVYFSGPLEEGVRLAVLLITGMSMHWALSIGQGWAALARRIKGARDDQFAFTCVRLIVVWCTVFVHARTSKMNRHCMMKS
jgi:hypothetical protein